MKRTLKMKVTHYTKKEGTKTVWQIESVDELHEITEEQYNNIVDAAPFFRRLGGTETLSRSYTSNGYKVTSITSTSPDKQNRTVREFKFDVEY